MYHVNQSTSLTNLRCLNRLRTPPTVVSMFAAVCSLSNLKKSQKKWFDPLFSRTERSINLDPDAYRYKWSNGNTNFQEHLEHFISEQGNHFQVVFDRLRINQYSIDWSKVIDKQDLSKSLRFFLSKALLFFSKSLRFFLSKTLPFFFVSIGNIPIHRSEIHIYELKGIVVYNYSFQTYLFGIIYKK